MPCPSYFILYKTVLLRFCLSSSYSILQSCSVPFASLLWVQMLRQNEQVTCLDRQITILDRQNLWEEQPQSYCTIIGYKLITKCLQKEGYLKPWYSGNTNLSWPFTVHIVGIWEMNRILPCPRVFLFFKTGLLCIALAILELCRPGYPLPPKC